MAPHFRCGDVMGQVLKQDKVGLLSESGGTITLAPSILTIGGVGATTQSLVSPSNGLLDQTDPFTFAATDDIRLDYTVEIQEWSTTPLKDL